MKKYLNRVGEKLKSDRGESIAEVLISVLISAVALVMLASMISSATSMIGSSRKNMEDYYSAANQITSSGASANFSGQVKMVPSESGSVSTSFSVNYFVNDELGKGPVVSFEEIGP